MFLMWRVLIGIQFILIGLHLFVPTTFGGPNFIWTRNRGVEANPLRRSVGDLSEVEDAVKILAETNARNLQGSLLQLPRCQSAPEVRRRGAVVQNPQSCEMAGGATGAVFLNEGSSGKRLFVAKKIAPLKEGLAMKLVHKTFQDYLAKSSANFSYVNNNEAAASDLAKLMGMQDVVPETSERCLSIVMDSKKCSSWVENRPGCQKYAVSVFLDGKKEFSKKGRENTEENFPVHRLKEQEHRAEVTRAALFTILVGNIDLHGENVLLNKNYDAGLGLKLIDFGLGMPTTTDVKHKQPVFSLLGDTPIDDSELRRVQAILKNPAELEKIQNLMEKHYNVGAVQPHFKEIYRSFMTRVEYIKRLVSPVSFAEIMAPLDPEKKNWSWNWNQR